MKNMLAKGIAASVVMSVASAQVGQPAISECPPLGSAIVHLPPLFPPFPGYSITIGGTFDLVSQSPGHCADGMPQDPCSFEFEADMWFDVQPPGTPTQGDLCLTQQGGTVQLLCGPMAIPEAPPGSGHYPIEFPDLDLQSICGRRMDDRILV